LKPSLILLHAALLLTEACLHWLLKSLLLSLKAPKVILLTRETSHLCSE
jgi:hypothetical protein